MNRLLFKRIALVCALHAAVAMAAAPSQTRKNAALAYWRAFAVMNVPRGADLRSVVEGKRQVDKAVRKVLRANRLALGIAKEATRMEVCDFQLDYDKGFEMLLPHLAKARTLARLLVAEGKSFERDGRWSDAVDSYLAGIRLGVHMSNDAVIVSSLVSASIINMSASALGDCAARMPADQRLPQGILRELAALPKDLGNWQAALRTEKRVVLQQLKVLDKKQLTQQDLAKLLSVTGVAPKAQLQALLSGALPQAEASKLAGKLGIDGADVRAIGLLREYLDSGRDEYKGFMDRLIGIMSVPRANCATEIQAIKQDVKDASLFPSLFLPALTRMRDEKAKLDLTIRTTMLTAALADYKAKHGRYPGSLADLPQTPLQDPFTGKPFKYARTDAGYQLLAALPTGQGHQVVRSVPMR